MRTLSFVAALLLFAGCYNSQETKSAPQASAPAVQPAPQKVAVAPAAVTPPSNVSDNNQATTVTPELLRKTETSPAELFQKCAACHGNHAEKSALNQSAVIGEWDSKRIVSAIVGYQDGTYGGAMKTLMQNQVKGLSRVQIEALSEYIANLYVKTH